MFDDDYDDIEFADSECCCLCGEPFYYVGRSSDDSDVCKDCDPT